MLEAEKLVLYGWLAGWGATRKKETNQPHSFQSEGNSILSTTEYFY